MTSTQRYTVDKGRIAIHDTKTDTYAPYVTVGRATEDARYLNEGIGYKDNLSWLNGPFFRALVNETGEVNS